MDNGRSDSKRKHSEDDSSQRHRSSERDSKRRHEFTECGNGRNAPSKDGEGNGPDFQLAKRPGHGKVGEKVQLIVNYFRLNLCKITVYHYDVEVEKLWLINNVNSDDLTKKRKKIQTLNANHAVIKQLIDENNRSGQTFRGLMPIFDGQRMLYTTKRLELSSDGEQTFRVKVRDAGEAGEYEVKIKFVRRVSYDPHYDRQASDDVLHMLEVLFTYGPRFARSPKLVLRSTIFDTKIKHEDLPLNKSLCYGYSSGVRNAECGLVINIDRNCGVFNKGGKLIQVIESILGIPSLSRHRLMATDVERLNRSLKHLKLCVTHLPYQRKFTYLRLSDKCISEITFDNCGKIVSVKDYFEQKYGDVLRRRDIRLNGSYPCILTSSKAYLPLEVCELMPYQPTTGKLPDEILSQITRQAARMRLEQRFDVIKQSQRSMCEDNERYFREFGVKISSDPIKVIGRVLPIPQLENKDCRDRPSVFSPQNRGFWKMINPDKHFYSSASLKKWFIFNFVQNISNESLEKFVRNYVSVGKDLGMLIEMPIERPPTLNYGRQFIGRMAELIFDRAKSKCNDVQLLMFIIDKEDGLYEEIKHCGDVRFGIPTQCISGKHFRGNQNRGPMAFNRDFLCNVLQKTNSRLGGVNTALEMSYKPEYLRKLTMVVGIDVTHPAPADRVSRSVAACVASMDQHHWKYYSRLKVQEPFVKIRVRDEERDKLVEEIVKLDEMMKEHLTTFKEINGRLPENIIVYRDGVSDGQFKHVFIYEIKALKKCFKHFEGYSPNLTIVTVQKRHHTRFMPDFKAGARTESKSGNIMPGTCVDDVITSPMLFDFFLCSHDGPLGTSRPARYCVLYDEYGFNADELQLVTYRLCYLYARCLKAVSIPAPVYYAHFAAKRAREHVLYLHRNGGRAFGDTPELSKMQDAVNTVKSNSKNYSYYI